MLQLTRENRLDIDTHTKTNQKVVRAFTIFASLLALSSCGDESAFDVRNGEQGGDYYSSENNGYSYDEDQAEEPIPENTDEFVAEAENVFIDAATTPISTFSIDVDNASYTVMRNVLNNGRLPDKASVRVEEYLNFFDYKYAQPTDETPFSIHLEMADSAFGADKHLLRVALQAKEIPLEDLKPTNLVFLVDVSGSMSAENKLPLIKESLRVLLETLRPTDTVSVVTYASAEEVILPPTQISERDKIIASINTLEAGGGTYGEGGLRKAYELAELARKVDGNNRVIICTDGDFNLGITGDDLFDFVESYREKQITLTAIGFGQGNYKDYTMETLASRANGNYFYIDSIEEAQRIFGEKITSTIEVVAADVKIQLEFDPQTVSRYRLIGYENRLLNEEDFNDDRVDAGEVGPGHNVTALYEIELKESGATSSLANFRVRYKERFGTESKLIEKGIKASANRTFEEASSDFRFAAAVVEFGEILRESMHVDTADMARVKTIAEAASDNSERQNEFVRLIDIAKSLLK